MPVAGVTRPVRRVLRLIERRVDARGQITIAPEVELAGWTTSLAADQFNCADIMALYADHGTHEQFHSEFKTVLDLTRLPSGKFDTNYLVCQPAAIAMNILRLIGQRGLLGPDTPVRHAAKRQRLKTVMQALIYRAGRLISTGSKLILGFEANDRSAKGFSSLHGGLFATSTYRVIRATNTQLTNPEFRRARRWLRRGQAAEIRRTRPVHNCSAVQIRLDWAAFGVIFWQGEHVRVNAGLEIVSRS